MTISTFRSTAALRDMACGAFFCGFSLIGLSSVTNSPALMDSLNQGLDPGPALLPLVTLGLMLIGGSLIMAKGLWRWVQYIKHSRQSMRPASSETCAKPPKKSSLNISQHLHAAALLASLALLPSVIQWLGFLPAVVAMALPWLVWLGYRRTHRITQATLFGCLISSLLCLTLYLIFITLLDVPL